MSHLKRRYLILVLKRCQTYDNRTIKLVLLQLSGDFKILINHNLGCNVQVLIMG